MKDYNKNYPNDRSKTDDETGIKKSSSNSPNPPRTTTGKLTAPKFGSAGGGGAELEPGPEKD